MDYDSQRLFRHCITSLFLWLSCTLAYGTPNEADLSVWVNEAIVSTYTFSSENFLARQKAIAKYFTTQGWINYTKALEAAKLKDSVEKNNYTVSAVALLPPTIQFLSASNEWQAKMPLLVLYKNKDYQQKQTLEVIITFVSAKEHEGVRGLALTSFTTTISTPSCRCEKGTKPIIV